MTPDDKEQELAYYPQVLQDIRDIKARPWSFITILVVITGGIVAFEKSSVEHIRHLLCAVAVFAAAATAFMAVHSFIKLKGRRERLDWVYEALPRIKEARGRPDDDVRKPHIGDWVFLGIGILGPVIAVWMVFCRLYASMTCPWLLCS
jgi:hypothetical protein